MSDNKKEELFSQFPPVETEQWEAVINADLKGADYQKKLVWKTAEGFSVRPYYRAEDLKDIKYMGAGCGEFPYVRGNKCCNHWRIHETIAVESPEKANSLALRALAAGAESIGFCLSGPLSTDDAEKLLNDIELEVAEVTFTGEGVKDSIEAVYAYADKKKVSPEKFRAFFSFDPVMNKLSLHGEFGCSPDGSKCFATIAEVIRKAERYPRVRVVGIEGYNFHNSGSTIVQELAFSLAMGHEYVARLMENGLTIDQAAHAIRFSLAISSNYFMEIAKFRAGRILWANIVKAYKPESDCSEKMLVHAVTSKWNTTSYDPYVNMLRGTTEAMSASIAGVHSLEVLPFDAAYESPTEFSARIARNVQLLLKHESHFDNVVDPAGGSYYIETLTQNIAQQAWELFKEVESRGGYVKAFQDGFIPDAVAASAAAKDKAIATRRSILLGTNQYPNFMEVADKAITKEDVHPEAADVAAGLKALRPYRGGMAFEQMRLRVDRSGKSPRAFMLTCGSLSMARARSQFACNFFACAGIRVEDNTFFQTVEEGVQAALKSGAEIVVICASDDDYTTLAPQAKELLGGKAILVVAGDPASRPELETKGVANYINVKSNVLETLEWYLKELGL